MEKTFETVKLVTIANGTVATGALRLEKFLSKKASEVITKKMGDTFIICFSAELMNFKFSAIKWFDDFRGKFYINNHSIYFRIEDDLMTCW